MLMHLMTNDQSSLAIEKLSKANEEPMETADLPDSSLMLKTLKKSLLASWLVMYYGKCLKL